MPGIPKGCCNEFLDIFEPVYREYYDTVANDFDGPATFVLQMDDNKDIQDCDALNVY